MSETSKYPIDFDLIEKGQCFTMDRLSEIFGRDKFPPGSPQLRMKALNLKQQIEDECLVTCKLNDDGLFVLTDAEAVEHNQSIFKSSQKQMRRRYELNAHVDIGQLDPAMQRRHMEGMIHQGRLLQAMRRATREIKKEIEAIRPAEIPGAGETVKE
jgi:hypothetical protein